MSNPKEILISRFGDLLLRKKENLKIVSKQENEKDEVYSVYQSLVDVGASLPVLVAVLTKPSMKAQSARLSQIPIDSLHVRSYRNWGEFQDLGIETPGDYQILDSFDLSEAENFELSAVSETKDSRTYKFENSLMGTMTLFTHRTSNFGNSSGLPNKTKFLGWINEYNFVYKA